MILDAGLNIMKVRKFSMNMIYRTHDPAFRELCGFCLCDYPILRIGSHGQQHEYMSWF